MQALIMPYSIHHVLVFLIAQKKLHLGTLQRQYIHSIVQKKDVHAYTLTSKEIQFVRNAFNSLIA